MCLTTFANYREAQWWPMWKGLPDSLRLVQWKQKMARVNGRVIVFFHPMSWETFEVTLR